MDRREVEGRVSDTVAEVGNTVSDLAAETETGVRASSIRARACSTIFGQAPRRRWTRPLIWHAKHRPLVVGPSHGRAMLSKGRAMLSKVRFAKWETRPVKPRRHFVNRRPRGWVCEPLYGGPTADRSAHRRGAWLWTRLPNPPALKPLSSATGNRAGRLPRFTPSGLHDQSGELDGRPPRQGRVRLFSVRT
jgi:hypothetical protein